MSGSDSQPGRAASSSIAYPPVVYRYPPSLRGEVIRHINFYPERVPKVERRELVYSGPAVYITLEG